jgi:hypothetical protein
MQQTTCKLKKQLLTLTLILVSLTGWAQDEKKENMIDKHVLEQTLLKGETGLAKTEMQDYASETEITSLLAGFPDRNFLLFPEARANSIRLLDGIPSVWAKRDAKQLESIELTAQPGEYFVFQIGVFAARADINSIQWHSSGFKGQTNLNGLTCFNLEGTDIAGKKIIKKISVRKGEVQPLWFGVQIPETAIGEFTTRIEINAKDQKPQAVTVKLNVAGMVVKNNGFDDGNRLSRMAWLNSVLGESDQVTKGYTPMVKREMGFSILGREVKIAANGLPQEMNSFFGPNNETLVKTAQPILKEAMRFVVELANGQVLNFRPGKLQWMRATPAQLQWKVLNTSVEASLEVIGTAEFDGFVGYQIKLISKQNLAVKDIRLEIPMTAKMSGYMMGMGKEGGFRPESWSWKWNVQKKGQDDIWIGGVNGGLRIKLKDDNYRRQLVNVYYPFCPLLLPKSWGNENKGGATIETIDHAAKLTAFSGERKLAAKESLFFNCELLITPLKMIDKNVQFNDRYYHSDKDVSTSFISEAEKAGANIINVHHKKDIYPFINYPYLPESLGALTRFVDDAHAKNIRTKVYYTTRELTVNTPEIWAMRSLNGEVIFPGPGKDAKTVVNPQGPHPWLIENFKTEFIPAWKCTFSEGPYKGRQDLSVITTPDSRMNNFFLGGLDWMCRKMKIDGIYIDDSALDRETLRRARRIMDATRPAPRIDLHTWNHFNDLAGNTCCLNLYMDLLPYLDMMWIGEGRDYNRSADYWLVETAGIPFGLTSQMLQDGGNKWRGMVFGMTNRLGWYGPTPEYLWKFWDEQKIQEMEMIGFWDDNCPVKADQKDIVTTVFKGKESAIIAVANWTGETQSGKLTIDWGKLGCDPSNTILYIPEIKEFQSGQEIVSLDKLTIPGKKGFLIVLKKKKEYLKQI